MIGSSWWVVTEYMITPRYILDLMGGSITADPPAISGPIHNSQWINFETSEYGPEWMVQSVTFTVKEAITAGVTVTSYRATEVQQPDRFM